MRALIVEDDPICSKLLHRVLSAYGHCDTAANGKEAVNAFRRSLNEANHYNLICMDIRMPVLGGQAALRQIREVEKQVGISTTDEVKVIMTTALSRTSEAAEALFKGGACAYFVKPIEMTHFINELKELNIIPT